MKGSELGVIPSGSSPFEKKNCFESLVNTNTQLRSKGGPLLPPLGDISNFLVRLFFGLNEEIPVQSA